MIIGYEEFKKVVVERFPEFLPEAYRKNKIEIVAVEKTNKKLDALTIHIGALTPTVYIEHMYEDYQKLGDIDPLLKGVANALIKQLPNMKVPPINLENLKDNIVFSLINTEQNKEMLKDMPHRAFHDLSIVYRWILDDENGLPSTLIHNQLAEAVKMTEDDLFKYAAINSERILKPKVMTMKDAFIEMSPGGTSEELINLFFKDMPPLYIMSNEKKAYGAVTMLYEHHLHDLAEKFDSDLYILPSSIHEVIVIPSLAGDPEELAEMVCSVNGEEVDIEERLSNQVYHYDKGLRKLSLATDTPNKRLD